MKNSNTEENILNAAISIFQKKGMSGARMQEIADEAQINKAMLHYYYRSKKQLFEAVFKKAFQRLAPQLNLIFASKDDSVFEKIEKFTSSYIDFILENPYLPGFIIHELNNNPDFIKTFMLLENRPDPQPFLEQIDKGIKAGKLKKVKPKQLLLNILSLTIFPFVAETMVKVIMNISDKEFIQLIEERKILISEQIIDSIKL